MANTVTFVIDSADNTNGDHAQGFYNVTLDSTLDLPEGVVTIDSSDNDFQYSISDDFITFDANNTVYDTSSVTVTFGEDDFVED
jgi:hypothetical protein